MNKIEFQFGSFGLNSFTTLFKAEVATVVFQLGAEKAHGLDEFSGVFYQKF